MTIEQNLPAVERRVMRIWKGKKEYATQNYFCGQVWNTERELWDTVTAEFDNEEAAENAMTHNAKEQPNKTIQS